MFIQRDLTPAIIWKKASAGGIGTSWQRESRMISMDIKRTRLHDGGYASGAPRQNDAGYRSNVMLLRQRSSRYWHWHGRHRQHCEPRPLRQPKHQPLDIMSNKKQIEYSLIYWVASEFDFGVVWAES